MTIPSNTAGSSTRSQPGSEMSADPGFTPSGKQLEITHGDQHAIVVEVGGGVREYRVGSRHVLDPYPIDAMCDGAHGTPLIPWPNRLADGHYVFDDNEFQLALTEPASRTAIHGLLRWRNWDLLDQQPACVVVGTVLRPMAGYPFCLDVRVSYELDDDGLRITTFATNIGATAAPWACGAHPYLSPGEGLIDERTLEFRAGLRIETDDRGLPLGEAGVAGTEYDFSQPRPIGSLEIDHAFKNVERDGDGRAWIRLTGVDGRRAELWCDASYPIVELYTGDTLRPDRRRLGIGVEPMSAPPNAFASGESLLRLEPGATTTHVWGVRLSGGAV